MFSGIIHGRMSNRWGPPDSSRRAAARLEELPVQFGKWRMRSPRELSDAEMEQLQPTGYVFREYVNDDTGEALSPILLVGPVGQISVHTPEVCMAGQDYKQQGARQQVPISASPGEADTFWAATFRTNDVGGRYIRVYWGWSTGGPWSAPDNPRFGFAGQPYLYKIQLVTALGREPSRQKEDACQRFLQDFVHEARQYLIVASTE